MAWELVTEVFGLDPDRLWVTVHLSDDEAAEIWENEVGVPADRIQRLDEDNWWRMADTGPNGPCSEIFYDMGPEFGEDGGPEARGRGPVHRDLEPGLHAVRDRRERATRTPCPSRRSTPGPASSGS